MEGAATTVYANGGRGNARLVAWDGERTVTFTMEDALISPEGFMILSGAGLIEASEKEKIYVHATERAEIEVADGGAISFTLNQVASKDSKAGMYVMFLNNDEVVTEPYIPAADKIVVDEAKGTTTVTLDKTTDDLTAEKMKAAWGIAGAKTGDIVLVDYYVEKTSGARQINITPDKFGGNYYLEASTLFRDTNGVDMPAEFIIPNCKIQSNFTFTMASSGRLIA